MDHNSDDDMQDDYSHLFAKQTPERGKYHERALRAKRLVEIDEDLLQAFPHETELNAALRGLIEASQNVCAYEAVRN